MYTFEAKVSISNGYTIEIVSNTHWSCKVDGNFMLSKYSGIGNYNAEILIPNDIKIANGTVTFSYGDERCKYPEVYVYLDNKCWINTNPKYIECGENKEKTIFFFYSEPREVFYVSVENLNGWSVDSADFKYITNNNEVMIIASGSDGELRIVPTETCGGKSIVHVKLVKKR